MKIKSQKPKGDLLEVFGDPLEDPRRQLFLSETLGLVAPNRVAP